MRSIESTQPTPHAVSGVLDVTRRVRRLWGIGICVMWTLSAAACGSDVAPLEPTAPGLVSTEPRLTSTVASVVQTSFPVSGDTKNLSFVAHMAARQSSVAIVTWVTSLTDMLPNTVVRLSDGSEYPVETRAILAEIIDVEPGYGFVDHETESEQWSDQVAFDDADASWRTVHIVLRPLEEFSPDGSPSEKEIRVATSLGTNLPLEVIRSELAKIANGVFVLGWGEWLKPYDSGFYFLEFDGAMFGTIDQSGTIEWPMLDPTLAPLFDGWTVDELREAGNEPTRYVDLIGGEGAYQKANPES